MKFNTFPKHSFLSLLLAVLFVGCKTTGGDAQSHHYTNELIHESSPYLLQHAHNPVNWHAWNDETLAKAKKEGKMLIISIGYSACHWCHVMEHESFEDTAVARLMNEHFINIKVDREERPDVDDVYMTACQMVSEGGCGWPLNAFAMPDGKPVWAGTYFPKKKWMEIMEYFHGEWVKSPEKMQEYADGLTEGLNDSSDLPVPAGEAIFTETTLDLMADILLRRIDYQKGGRKGAPKFPMPSNYEFLLKNYYSSGDPKSLEAVTITLDEMAKGGIYDHLGGGFARYSVDEKWLVPHFEKMLYDNSQLVSLYSNAYRLTKDLFYKKTVEETLEYIAREMTSEVGAFYSSLDADSDGEEGKFYVWQKSEIDSLLGNDAKIFNEYYNVFAGGNWEHGKNILHLKKDAKTIAAKNNLSEKAFNDLIKNGKDILFKYREKRIRPGLDDKALTGWNALMLTGYVDAYKAFNKKEYLNVALKNGQFILDKMLQPDFRLNRNYKDGKSVINAFLDDYVLTVQAFIDLYEITFDEKWLNTAKGLTEYVLTHFDDANSDLYFYTSDIDPALITRKIESTDNVIPGSNSVMAKNLHELGLYFYKNGWIEKAQAMMHTMANSIVEGGAVDFYTEWTQVYWQLVHPPYEVAIVGAEAAEKRNQFFMEYHPDAILLGGENEGTLELLKNKLQEGETMIYVCQNKVCNLPVSDVKKAIELLK